MHFLNAIRIDKIRIALSSFTHTLHPQLFRTTWSLQSRYGLLSSPNHNDSKSTHLESGLETAATIVVSPRSNAVRTGRAASDVRIGEFTASIARLGGQNNAESPPLWMQLRTPLPSN